MAVHLLGTEAIGVRFSAPAPWRMQRWTTLVARGSNLNGVRKSVGHEVCAILVAVTCGHPQGEGPAFQAVLRGFDSRCPLYIALTAANGGGLTFDPVA